MPLQYDQFQNYCKSLKLYNAQQALCQEYNVKHKVIFNINNQDTDMLWQQYNFYKNQIRNVESQDQNLLDPHKIASCMTASLMHVKAFQINSRLYENTRKELTSQDNISAKELLNEMFAFLCGIEFLKYALVDYYINIEQDMAMAERSAQLTSLFKNIPVNRYNPDSSMTYLEYVSYNLVHCWELRPSDTAFSRQDILNLAQLYHSIENYCLR